MPSTLGVSIRVRKPDLHEAPSGGARTSRPQPRVCATQQVADRDRDQTQSDELVLAHSKSARVTVAVR